MQDRYSGTCEERTPPMKENLLPLCLSIFTTTRFINYIPAIYIIYRDISGWSEGCPFITVLLYHIPMMMTVCLSQQVLLTTDALAQPWSISVWDTDTGSSVSNFKGQAVAPRCLCLRGSHTLIGATENKPVLQLWPLSKKVIFCDDQ